VPFFEKNKFKEYKFRPQWWADLKKFLEDFSPKRSTLKNQRFDNYKKKVQTHYNATPLLGKKSHFVTIFWRLGPLCTGIV
jgi:hypothetical protein